MKHILTCLLLITVFIESHAQKNKSPENAYRNKNTGKESAVNPYNTQYDKGYVLLLDSTLLKGNISISGNSYESIWTVKIKTDNGGKYDLSPTSLLEYGLDRTSKYTNDTPSKFRWGKKEKKFFKWEQKGYASNGYVVLNSGDRYEGSIELKEINGRLESVKVDKEKYEMSDIKNFGVMEFIDPKFDGPFPLVEFRPSMSSLSAAKSREMDGYVILKNGTKITGELEFTSTGAEVKKIMITPVGEKKKQKYDYEEVQKYGSIFSTKNAYESILRRGQKLEHLHPRKRFYPGKIELLDETIMEGLVARRSTNDLDDVFFSKDETGPVLFIDGNEIEDITQEIPDEDIKAYDDYIYDITHIKDYLIQNPPRWEYEKKTDEEYVTKYQPGYVVNKDGTERIGAIQVRKWKNGNITIRFKEVGDDNKETSGFTKYGLIDVESTTAFPREVVKMGGLFSKVQGFIQLVGSDEVISGKMFVNRNSESGEITFFNMVNEGEGEKIISHPPANVERYGPIDVPMTELLKYLVSSDEKEDFHQGSFKLNGQVKNGFIAYTDKNQKSKYRAFFFADKLDGVANVYYLDNPLVSEVNQIIPEKIIAYDPYEDEFLEEESLTPDVKNNGFVITYDGTKIEGAIQIDIPEKRWYAQEVIVTTPDGTVTNYENDGSLRRIVFDYNGETHEYIDYEGEYVRLYGRSGTWVYFRNPHPTTPSVAASYLNDFLSEVASRGFQDLENSMNKKMMSRAISGDKTGYAAYSALGSVYSEFKKYWEGKDLITWYKKELIVLNEADYNEVMIIPSLTEPAGMQPLNRLLEGTIEFHDLPAGDRRSLYRLKEPKKTLAFLAENMNN